MDTEVAAYGEELSKKEQQLGELHISLRKQLRDCHITEVIRQNRDNRERIAAAKQLTTGECGILRKMVVAQTGLSLWIEYLIGSIYKIKILHALPLYYFTPKWYYVCNGVIELYSISGIKLFGLHSAFYLTTYSSILH